MSKLHDLYLYGYALFLWMLSLQIPYAVILFVIYLYKVRKLILIQYMLVLLFLGSCLYFFETLKNQETSIDDVVIVVDIESFETVDMLVIKKGGYKYQIMATKDKYIRGDQLFVSGEIKPYPNQTIPFGFNQEQYYKSKNIDGWIEPNNIQYVDHSFHVMSYRDQFMKKLDDLSSKDLILTLVFDENQIPKEEKVKLQHAGLVQLLSLSGIHLYVLGILIKKILYIFNIDKYKQEIIILLIYVMTLYIQDFSMPSLRLCLLQLFLLLNSSLKWRLTNLDGIQIVFFIMMVTNISYVFHLGFLITYIVLNVFELNQYQLMSKNDIEKRMFSYVLLMLVLLPFQNKISLFWFILVPIFSIYLVGPIFIFALLTLGIHDLDPILHTLYQQLLTIIEIIENDIIIFYFGALETYEIFIYFICFIYFLTAQELVTKVKRFIIIIIILCLPFIKYTLSNESKIYFLDVGQGDSIFIQTPHVNVMIDAYYHTDTFLHDIGVKTLDYLILTHSDEDHVLNANKLIEEFQVNTLILNPFDQYQNYQIEHIMYAKNTDSIIHDDLVIDFLGPIERLSEDNNTSLVFKVTIHQKTILFTGDIEEDGEKMLVETYQDQLKADVIKVPHHGSITSSSKDFIKYVDPHLAIISVGRDNRFDFPSDEIIKRYQEQKVTIYRTDRHGTILCRLKEGEEKWSFFLPFPS